LGYREKKKNKGQEKEKESQNNAERKLQQRSGYDKEGEDQRRTLGNGTKPRRDAKLHI